MNLLQLYMTDIESGLNELCELVRKYAQPEGAVLFSLPQISKEDEARLIADDYDAIPVTPLYGQYAVNEAIRAYKDMYVIESDISRRFVQKYPGLIPLSCSWGELAAAVDKVNQAKMNFRNEVQRYDDAAEKFFEVHDRFNYLITTMAYRRIYAYEGDHKGFYFNWSRRPRVETHTASQWIEKLNSARYTIPPSHSKSSWNALVDQEQQLIADCGSEKLSMRRPIKLRPECSVRDANGIMKGYSAGLPFLLAGHTGKQNFTVLQDYTRKPTHKSSAKWQLVVERPRLYKASSGG